MKTVRILPAVLDDAAQAANWYDSEGAAGLGNRFLGIFYSTVMAIQQRGEIHRPVYKEFRRVLLAPFPYAVYYRYHKDWVVISLPAHAARDPRFVRKSLRERKSDE